MNTPKPWKVNVVGPHWNNPQLTHIEVTYGDDGECVCDTVYQMDDANLIASAPDLRDALEALILFTNPTKRNSVALHNAHLALAKSRVESS